MAFTAKDWKDYPDTSTPITAAALEDLESRVVNAGLQLNTGTGKKVAFGTISLTLNGTSGRSQATGYSAHGLGSTPTYAVAIAHGEPAISEDSGTVAHAVMVNVTSLDSNNVNVRAEINGTSNNAVTVHWVAIL